MLRPPHPPTLFTLAALLSLALALPSEVFAQDRDPLDLSEYERPLWPWPFTVLDAWVERDGLNIKQFYLVQETPQQVYDTLDQMHHNHEQLGDYVILGRGYLTHTSSYTVTVALRNLTHGIIIDADGTGSLLTVQGTPLPLVSGRLKRSFYPYRLEGDLRVGTEILNSTE